MYAFFTNNNKNKRKTLYMNTHHIKSNEKQKQHQTENWTQKTKSRFQMQF